MKRNGLWLIVLLLGLFIPDGSVAAASPTQHSALSTQHFLVSPTGPYTTLVEALADAQDGDTIEVHGGTYPAPLLVDKSVTLEGVDWPVIDGGGLESVVTLAAANITFRGFIVRGSGNEPDRNHAGIAVNAANILVENNRLEDVLFGIYVAEGSGAILRGNDITSKNQYDLGRKGDGVRIWYSPDVLVEQNVIHETRDLVIWYSPGVIIRDNEIRNGRYGVHLMYTDNITITGNRLLDNSVGVFTMYSHQVFIHDNLIRGHRGPSGYALGFKDADDVQVSGNVLLDNSGGIFLDGTPFNPQAISEFTNNILAFNDVAVTLQPAVKGNLFSHNTFWENVAQTTIQGGGTPGINTWQDNTWSDYTGFDADGDGQGDVPYRSERFFENMMDEEARLRVLLYSPAVQAIEMAARSFPLIRPQPKFVDETPQMTAAAIPSFAQLPAQPAGKLVGAAAIFLTLALVGMGLGRSEVVMKSEQLAVSSQQSAVSSEQSAVSSEQSAVSSEQLPVTSHQSPVSQSLSLSISQSPSLPLSVRNLSKSYGSVPALRQVSFTAEAGEAIALWGENGAGKTTLVKAILGLISYQGEIQVLGQDAQKAGKAARRAIGYVPQEVLLSDWSVEATLRFFCRLKKTNPQVIPGLLQKLGLSEHKNKAVPALSGGLRQRLALALALLADPPVLLLDEPTANLDTQARWDYLGLLADLRHEGKTILFASHRLEEVEALADRVLVLEQGQMVGLMTVGELRPRIQTEIPARLQGRKVAEWQNSTVAEAQSGNGVIKPPVWQPTTQPAGMINGQ